jgi:hypothetical protein
MTTLIKIDASPTPEIVDAPLDAGTSKPVSTAIEGYGRHDAGMGPPSGITNLGALPKYLLSTESISVFK